jgi:signal transduction histidine kinase
MSAVEILIADDHESFRRSLRNFLESKRNWRICGEAADGVEAIEKAKELHPDIVLMDVSMPRMDGLQATRAIRKHLPETNVIIISQNDPVVVSREYAEVGAHGFISKSNVAGDLISKIENAIRKRRDAKSSNEQTIDQNDQPSVGEMSRLIKGKDWSKTAVGAAENWSPSLRMMIDMLLANRFPLLLWWGSDYIQFYNDAYRPIPGVKHPKSLGQPARECWPEIWHILKPLIDTPFHGGEATWIEDFELEVHRSKFPEETHFTVAYSPVPDPMAPAGIGGVLATVHEITSQVIGERRLALLRELAARATEGKTAEDACLIAAETFTKDTKDLPFAALYLFDSERRRARLVASAGVETEEAATALSIEVAETSDHAFGHFAFCATNQNSIVVVDELASRLAVVPPGPWSDPPHTAVIVPLPSTKTGEIRGFVVHGVSARLELDDAYRTFFQLVAAQIATAISNAEAYEEERKRAEALAEIDRAKTVFFSNVSHEFRTPLTLMLGPLQDLLARSETHLSATAKEQLELANRNGARLLRLVNTLLDFSRIEAGRVQALYEATDLAKFTPELAGVFRSATEKAGLRLVTDCCDLGEPVYVDRDMWEKVVLNLISNAFKFTFEGEIVVSVRKLDDKAQLRVRDTGVGIPPEAMPKLFERFQRIPNTRSRTHEGSGIGLALVQELVKLQGGSIRVESRVGRGTTFIVDIPFGQSHVGSGQLGGSRRLSSTATGAKPFVEEALRWLPDSATNKNDSFSEHEELLPVLCPPGAEPAGRSRILFADDNSDMRQYISRLLAQHYEVETAADGQAALAMARQNPPNLILADVMMPLFDGFELLKAIRSDERTRRVPVVLLSARAGEESRVEGMQAGADDYLIKPFSSGELLARISARLEIARVQQERELKLEQEVQERTRELLTASQELRELSTRILQAQDEERRRIARELHDGAGQLLAALNMELANVAAERNKLGPEAAASVSSIESLIAQMTTDIRTMSHLLYPPLLDEVGLESALLGYVNGFAERSGIKVILDFASEFGRLDREFELCLFRIVQECLTNIHRHSESKIADIKITSEGDVVNLDVRDKGRGVSKKKLAELQSRGSGVGIRGMRERVRQLSGDMTIESDNSGMRVHVTIPLPKHKASTVSDEPLQAPV